MVNKLKEDVNQREHHVKELESMLNSNGDDLSMKFNDLTKENMKLKRSAQAKQVFSEKLLKENKKLNEIINHRHELPVVKQEKPDVIGRDVPDGQSDEEKLNVSCLGLLMRF